MKFNDLTKFALALSLGLLMMACGQGPKEGPATPEAPEPPATPQLTEKYQVEDAMNPLKVYPDNAKVYADSLNLQMYELILKPGDSIALHEHLDHTVYVLEGGSAMVWVNGTDPVEYTMQTGTGWLGGPLVDAATNTGDTTIRLLITEVFRPRMLE